VRNEEVTRTGQKHSGESTWRKTNVMAWSGCMNRRSNIPNKNCKNILITDSYDRNWMLQFRHRQKNTRQASSRCGSLTADKRQL